MNSLKQLIYIYYRMVYIYKIYCKDKNIKDCYIGSTSNIKNRISQHKHSCNNENSENYNQYKYVYIRENSGWCNWSYDIICECTSEDRDHLERWYIENTTHTNLNKQIPTRNMKEYYQNNKKKIKEYHKEYRKLNIDNKKELDKKYREANKKKINEKHNCECGSNFRKADKSRHFKTQKHLKYIESLKINKT